MRRKAVENLYNCHNVDLRSIMRCELDDQEHNERGNFHLRRTRVGPLARFETGELSVGVPGLRLRTRTGLCTHSHFKTKEIYVQLRSCWRKASKYNPGLKCLKSTCTRRVVL